MMGARTLVDMVILEKVGDVGTFKDKLKALEKAGYVSSQGREVLYAALDLGSAAAHRGHAPTETEVQSVMDIVENMLQAVYVFPTGRTKNEGLNEGLGCVSYANLQVLRCHPCACKFFCISFPLNSYPMVGRFKISLSKQGRFWYFSITSRTKPSWYLKGCSDGQ